MKKKFLSVMVAMMIVLAFSSCGTPRSVDCVSDNRFLVVTDNIEGTGGNEIFADRETGVMHHLTITLIRHTLFPYMALPVIRSHLTRLEHCRRK